MVYSCDDSLYLAMVILLLRWCLRKERGESFMALDGMCGTDHLGQISAVMQWISNTCGSFFILRWCLRKERGVIYGIGRHEWDHLGQISAVMQWIPITCGLFSSCVIENEWISVRESFIKSLIAILDDIHASFPAL